MKEKITTSSGNVFADLGFEPGPALAHRIRSELMIAVKRIIESAGITQAQAAKLLGVNQPRVSDLVRGRIERFSIDALVEMLGRSGFDLSLTVSEHEDEQPLSREIEISAQQFESAKAGWKSTLESVQAPGVQADIAA